MESIWRIYKTMSGFFKNLNIINKPLFKLARERGFKITQLEIKKIRYHNGNQWNSDDYWGMLCKPHFNKLENLDEIYKFIDINGLTNLK